MHIITSDATSPLAATNSLAAKNPLAATKPARKQAVKSNQANQLKSINYGWI